MQDALGNTTSRSYDKNGNILTETDAKGGTSEYRYDLIGELLAAVNPAGYVSALEYDALGNVAVSYTHLDVYKRQAWRRWTETRRRRGSERGTSL